MHPALPWDFRQQVGSMSDLLRLSERKATQKRQMV